MPRNDIFLKHAAEETYTNALVRKRIQPTDADYEPEYLITGHTRVYTPDGNLLLHLLPEALALDDAKAVFAAFDGKLNAHTGSIRPEIKASKNKGSEGVVGYMDRAGRFPYCRMTALSMNHLQDFQAAMPFIVSASRLMQDHTPEQYAAQNAALAAARPEYRIADTCFSTTTWNRDVSVHYHADEGDYRPGIGVIATTWAKHVGKKRGPKQWEVVLEPPAAGGVLVFPRYKVAVRVRTLDLLLCNVHEVHGVTPIVGEPGTWARLSSVFYMRERIAECGSLEEEAMSFALKDTERKPKPVVVEGEEPDVS